MVNRIVSFLPSATEILYLLGCQHLLYGVTHQCNFPFEARSKPQIIKSVFDSESMTSLQIEEKIQELAKLQDEYFTINFDLLKEIQPDLVISQGICDVCSPHNREMEKVVRFLGYTPDTLVLDPHTVEDVVQNIVDVAKSVGKEDEGLQIKSSLQNRIEHVASTKKDKNPNVICMEWLDPFYIAGHWVPQMVQLAGGTNGVSNTGKRSRKIEFSQITQFDPDILILLPCGFTLDRVLSEYVSLRSNEDWNSLRAVKNDMVFAVDAMSYFSRPSPRVITGIEILAKIFNPKGFANLVVPENSYAKLIKDV
ncbi:MAG TPA: cobalamin-binding protein [Nitrososphaeraceae archaeon]|nr:cobalamin-binding protein [Nitrososphaeraceae archaeon]